MSPSSETPLVSSEPRTLSVWSWNKQQPGALLDDSRYVVLQIFFLRAYTTTSLRPCAKRSSDSRMRTSSLGRKSVASCLILLVMSAKRSWERFEPRFLSNVVELQCCLSLWLLLWCRLHYLHLNLSRNTSSLLFLFLWAQSLKKKKRKW